MTFLQLNGITIPTAKGGQIQSKDIGDPDGTAWDGSAQINIRGRKRTWKFTTKPINATTAKWLKGMIRGDGFYLPFDTNTLTKSGRQPSTNNNTTIVSEQAADGSSVFDWVGAQSPYGETAPIAMAPYGNGCLACDQGGTNLFSAAQSQGTGGWAVSGGGTVTNGDNTHFWEGTSSSKLSGTATTLTNQTTVTVSPLNAGDQVSVSLFIYPGVFVANSQFTITVGDGTNHSTINYSANTLNAFAWTRIGAFFSASGGSTTVTVSVAWIDGTGTSRSLWLDGAFMLKCASGSIDHTWPWWVVGGSSRSPSQLIYTMPSAGNQGLTFNCWASPNDQKTAANVLFRATNSLLTTTANYVVVYASGTTLNFVISNPNGTNTTVTTSIPATGWTMYTCVIDAANLKISVYKNGALAASASLANLFLLPGYGQMASNLSMLSLGSEINNTFDAWGGRIDEVEILPYAVDSTWVSQRYTYEGTNGNQISGPPLLLAVGNSIDDGPVGVLVQGKAENETYVGFADPNNANQWASQNRTLEITLREV